MSWIWNVTLLSGTLTITVTFSWWRHQMKPLSTLLALCVGNSPVPVNSLHKGQWCSAVMFSLICTWINDWVNNHKAEDLRCHHGHYDINLMLSGIFCYQVIRSIHKWNWKCHLSNMILNLWTHRIKIFIHIWLAFSLPYMCFTHYFILCVYPFEIFTIIVGFLNCVNFCNTEFCNSGSNILIKVLVFPP